MNERKLCEQRLQQLQEVVREHVKFMDEIMRTASTYDRGRQIARSVSNLELALTASIIQIEPQVLARLKKPVSGSTSPASAAMPGSSSSAVTAKPSSPAASLTRRKNRKAP